MTKKTCLFLLRSIAIFFLMLLFLYGFIVLIGWLMLHPHLPAVKAESLSASGFNTSNMKCTATAAKYDFQINITNPNRKVDMWIDHFLLRMFYRDVSVARVVLDPRPSIRILRNMNSEVEFQMNMTKLNDKKRKWIERAMGKDWSRRVIRFDVEIDVHVKFRSGVWPSKQELLKVSCKKLNILFPTPSPKDSGYLQEGKDCLVDYQ